MRYKTADGSFVDVLDKTRPVAAKDYPCCWGHVVPHDIKKGDRYVRVVHKGKGGTLESDHICLDCWCGFEKANGE